MRKNASQADTLLIFAEGDVTCALFSSAVQEVVFLPALARPPGMPSILEGVMTLDGKAVPVLRAARLLGLTAAKDGVYTPVLVLKGGGTALAVERMEDIFRPQAGDLVAAGEDQSFNGCVVAAARYKNKEIHVLDSGRLLLAGERQRIGEFKAMAQARLDEAGALQE